MLLLGLRTISYPALDLDGARAWFSELPRSDPYLGRAVLRRINVADYELVLDPNADLAAGPITHWGVPDAGAALDELEAAGATAHTSSANVGDGIRVASVLEPGGAVMLGPATASQPAC